MNNLPHIISKVTRQPWVITEDKLSAIMAALDARLSGEFQTVNGMPEPGEDECNGRDEYREFQMATGTVAVIPIHGIVGKHLSSLEIACGGCSLDTLQAQLKAAGNSPRITQILLDINSPGGTVTGTPETARLIAEIAQEKPVIGYTDGECCSAALWLASQCVSFYASESAVVGSVGIRMVLLDYTRKLEQEGVKVNAIASGKYKLLGAPFKALTEDERELLQAESDRIHAQFQAAVTARRDVATQYLQGQIFRGEEAVGIGMVDGVMDDIEDVYEMLNSPARLTSGA